MNKLLYTPIYINSPKIDHDFLNAEFDKNCLLHETKLWNFWNIRFKPYNFYNERWESRYDVDKVLPVWDENFKHKFSEAVEFLNKLPFKNITHINLLKQLKDIPPHIDYHKNEKQIQNQFCYKWLMVKGKDNSFFLEMKDKKIKFVNPPDEYSCFVIPESYIKHGAIKTNEEKIIMSIFGDLDLQMHNELIQLSRTTFHDQIICE